MYTLYTILLLIITISPTIRIRYQFTRFAYNIDRHRLSNRVKREYVTTRKPAAVRRTSYSFSRPHYKYIMCLYFKHYNIPQV